MGRRSWTAEGLVELLFGDELDRQRALAAEPGLHNVLGIEAAFKEDPLEMDFLDPASPYYYLKNLSTRIYRRLFDPFLEELHHDSIVLDAGCGIGRFTVYLAAQFNRVVAFDPSPSSLKACRRHLEEGGFDNVELHWADLSFLDDWSQDTFDAVFAVELICYVADPARALKRLVRVTKPGGLIFLSAEGRPGALSVQAATDPAQLMAALRGEPLLVEGDRFVIYFDQKGLGRILEDAGLAAVRLEGSHYFGEGPFWQSVDDERLNEPGYVESIIKLEEECRSDPVLAPWARVFSAVGKKR